jgi:putative ABC transport system permease protein
MSSYLPIFRRFILRALAREKLRSVITAFGISLGVAAMIAIRLANASSLDSFRAATESLAGETSIQITGTAGRFDELLVRDADWLRDYGHASPIVFGYAMIEPADSAAAQPSAGYPASARGEFLQILGIDALRDRPLRNYDLVRFAGDGRQPNTREFLLLLADPAGIVLTERFAGTHSLSIGNQITLAIGSSRRQFTIRGLLRDQGPARSLQGNFALMDIAAAQVALGRIGFLDRLDVKLKPGVSLEQAQREITARLPAGLQVTRPEASYGQVEKMIAAFHLNLTALGSIALLVGLFLIYNTVSISVISRREEVGSLRAVGAARKTVLCLFLGEALLLSVAGTLVGLGLGQLLAGAAVRATATTVETFYIASVATQSISHHGLGAAEVLMAFAVAVPLALTAAAVPALEAARVRPVEAIRGAERFANSKRPSVKYLLLSAALLVFGYMLSRLDTIGGLPIFGYASALALMFGGAFLVPGALWFSCKAISALVVWPGGSLQPAARLASANLRGAINRISISVAALSVSLAMMVAVSIMIGSFRDTVVYWVGQSMVADVYARPMLRTATTDEGEIPAAAVSLIKDDARVEEVYGFATRQLSYRDTPISIGAGDFSIFLRYGRLLFKSPGDARDQMRDAIGKDAIAVSEAFSIRFKTKPGDSIQLPTANGLSPFRIIAVYFDYSNSRGAVVMDRSSYERHFGGFNPSSLSIYLRPGADAELVKEGLSRQVSSRYPIFFITNSSLRREVMRIFDSTFAITYALEAIAIAIASLGVLSTLITLILERRREIAILKWVGATRAQIRRMIIIEAVTIGAVSQSIGVGIGLLLSLVLIYVINVQSFGWTIQFTLPVAFIVRSTLFILIATAVGGTYPAVRATRIDAVQLAREE